MDENPAQANDVSVRKLAAEDERRLVAIDEQITGRRRGMWYERRIAQALASDVQISLTAERDGLVVGAVLGSVQYGEFGLPEPVAVLDTLLVDPEFSGQGVASALIYQLGKNLRGLRIETLRTEVAWNEQQLLGFFGSRGFIPVPRLVLEAPIDKLEV